ncbi:MAG: arsenite S-adenosylmethyltransferase, partial [Bryobacteraceae bacterium]
MEIKEVVKEKYGQAAVRVANGGGNSCCGGSALESSCDPITAKLYGASEAAEVPAMALKASLGCGNPTALAELRAG